MYKYTICLSESHLSLEVKRTMLNNQAIAVAVVLLLTFVALNYVHAIENRHHGGGRHSRENFG